MSSTQCTEQAVTAAEAGQYEAAVKLFAAAIQLDEHNAALYEQQAQCYMELCQYVAASEAAERATVLKPAWAEAWLTLSRSLMNGGDLHGAYRACQKCLELAPEDDEAQDEMSNIDCWLEQQTYLLIGWPGLSIVSNPCAGTGPGCVIWEAGALLARLFVQVALLPVSSVQPAIVGADSVGLTQLPRLHGAHVLELGAGTGVAGITAATCGAHVLLTDLPAAQSLLQANITRNQALIQEFGGSAAAAVLDWDTQRDNHAHHPVEEQQHHQAQAQAQAQAQPGAQQGNSCSCTERLMIADTVGAGAVSSMATLSSPTWDWGCGADLVFNASQVEPVVQAIRCFVRAGAGKQARSRTFLLAHKQRHADVDQQLLGALSAAGCLVSTVHWGSVVPEMEQQQLSQVCLWAIQHHPV